MNEACSLESLQSVMKGAPAVGDMHMGDACHQMSIPVDDEEHEDLLSWFEPGTAFITAAIAAGGRVLVHCVAGVSRSPTVRSTALSLTRPCILIASEKEKGHEQGTGVRTTSPSSRLI